MRLPILGPDCPAECGPGRPHTELLDYRAHGDRGIVGAGFGLPPASAIRRRIPARTLAGHPGLLHRIKFYDERNALEEKGRCTAPLLEGVSRSEVLSEDQDQLVVAVVYRYRDALRDEPRAPSGRLPFFRECTGVASRTFMIATSGDHRP